MLPQLKLKNCLSIILGSAILAFGLYNIHSISGVTEGGVLGLTLLLEHWFGISPSISGLVLNGACYALGFTLLGREFIFYSFIAGGGFSLFYAIFERFPPLWPQIAQMPLAASVAGAAFGRRWRRPVYPAQTPPRPATIRLRSAFRIISRSASSGCIFSATSSFSRCR